MDPSRFVGLSRNGKDLDISAFSAIDLWEEDDGAKAETPPTSVERRASFIIMVAVI
jgi:hypothetical protein